jgi:hypothetical protein
MPSAHRVSGAPAHPACRFTLFTFMLLTASLCIGAEPNLLSSKPNIWGVWIGTGGYPDIDPRYRNTPWPDVSFTAWGAAESKRLGTPETPDECMPYGPAPYVAGGSLFPMEIARSAKGLLLMYEPSPVPRRIYADGRKHPEDLDPTWLGHSVGHWEGGTLVVDTIGVNGRGRPLNGYVSGAINSRTETAPRLPVSDQFHMIERIRLLGDGDYLENEITIDDPKTYTRSFTVKHYWQRRSDLDVLEYFCADNRRPDAEGHDGGKP